MLSAYDLFELVFAVALSISLDLWRLIEHVALRYKLESVNYGDNS